jgi:hypothetical protein
MEDFKQISAALEDEDPVSRFGAVRWSLEIAPATCLDLALEELNLGMKGIVPPPFSCSSPDDLQMRRGSVSMNRSRFAMESVVRYLHASGDLLAQLIRVTLLRGERLGENCWQSDVTKALAKRQELTTVLDAFSRFVDSEPFRYSADACNRLKHRDWMPFRQWAHLQQDGGVVAGSAIGPFEHGGTRHAEVDILDLQDLAVRLQELGVAVVGRVATAAPC